MDLRPVIDLVNIDTDKKDPSWVPPGKRKNGKRKNEEENQAKQSDVQNQDDVDEQDGVSDPENHQDHVYSKEDCQPEYEPMTLLHLHDLSRDKKVMIEYLQYLGALPKENTCQKCQRRMCMSYTHEKFRCQKLRRTKRGKQRCSYTHSLRKHTWFSKSRLAIDEILKLLYLLIYNFPVEDITRELYLSSGTVQAWRSSLHQVLTQWTCVNSKPIGGLNKVVEVDETKLCKLRSDKRKHIASKLAFCGIERETGEMFMVPIPDFMPETLHAVIKQWVLPGSRVLADVWKPSVLKQKYLVDLTVNHKLTFVDPKIVPNKTGVEPTVRHAKTVLPRYNNKKRHYPGYLSHYMFFKYCIIHQLRPFETLLRESSKIDFDLENIEMDQ